MSEPMTNTVAGNTEEISRNDAARKVVDGWANGLALASPIPFTSTLLLNRAVSDMETRLSVVYSRDSQAIDDARELATKRARSLHDLMLTSDFVGMIPIVGWFVKGRLIGDTVRALGNELIKAYQARESS